LQQAFISGDKALRMLPHHRLVKNAGRAAGERGYAEKNVGMHIYVI